MPRPIPLVQEVLDSIQIKPASEVRPAFDPHGLPWAVCYQGGVIAYFAKQADAVTFKLAYAPRFLARPDVS